MCKACKIEAWTVLFKAKYLKKKNKLIKKLRKRRKRKNANNTQKIDSCKAPLLSLIKENDNQCLQNNGYLFYFSGYNIVKINLSLSPIETEYKTFSKNSDIEREVIICAIPNQLFLCIDCGKGLVFIINQNLEISGTKKTAPRDYCMLLYLEELIYAFTRKGNYYTMIETYDYKKNKWRRMSDVDYDIWACVVFERKIIVAPFRNEYLKIFDPFANSFTYIFRVQSWGAISLLVANDRCYCIISNSFVFESLHRDYWQWTCIGKNWINDDIFGLHLFSFYNDSIYFIGIPHAPSLYEFNLKALEITLIDHLYTWSDDESE
ncbi:unnamed protein product [Blepharisma stoltei]|uniref:F-box associated domain-containing protein n=1 Tax=Blepharisma stoltei TaxID=1481888 RepID=A0AAU9J026_9CILI|nr:unnamed protein product [Blepharisma stoltei]